MWEASAMSTQVRSDFPRRRALLPLALCALLASAAQAEPEQNAVLLPSHYMAQSNGYDWLIGKGRALDPQKHFLIMTDVSPEDLAFIERRLRAFLGTR
jgi:hypothetical protein